MKKIFLSVILFCLLSIIFIPFFVKANQDPGCKDPTTGKYGIVRCGCSNPPVVDSNGNCTSCCNITDFFTILVNIYSFIVLDIATPLAIVAIAIGGLFMMVSAGNPNLMGTGKKILWSAIIGLVLVFGSWLIIDFILKAIGFTGNWSSL